MPPIWLPHERHTWSQAAGPTSPPEGWQPTIATITEGRARPQWGAQLAAFGPEAEVRRLLRTWTPEFNSSRTLPRVFVARFEEDALPTLRSMHFTRRATLSLPFADEDTAAFMTDALVRLRAVRRPAMEWFDRHADYAARHIMSLAPDQRDAALPALRYLVTAGRMKADATKAAEELLRETAPVTPPATRLPAWADPESMPSVPLAPDDIRAIVRALMHSTPAGPHPALAGAVESHQPAAVAELAWTLFDRWQSANSPSKHHWAYESLGYLGDDETVRRLVGVLPGWRLDNTRHKAETALDVLAELGSRAALDALSEISRRFRAASVREYAAERLAECAEAAGLTPEQLDDRLVPGLGLDGAGATVLDFGPRRFTVGLDESLQPRIADDEGRFLKTLPKPNAKDDAVLAQAATEEFQALKKQVRALADEQMARLEQALWARRRWSPDDFGVLLGHPLLRVLVRRLVWAVYDDGKATAFRVAEDLTFADVRDDAFEIPDGASLGLAHPLDLGDDLPTWSELFDDYRIAQPFLQLTRPTFALKYAEGPDKTFRRFQGVSVHPSRIRFLEQRGWQRGPLTDTLGWESLLRPVGEGRSVVVRLSPGYDGSTSGQPNQLLESVWIHRDGADRWGPPEDAPLLRSLDPVMASEVLRDLEEATAVGPGR